MNRRMAVASMLALTVAPRQLLAAPEVVTSARSAATDWLQKIDSSNYSGSWESAASMFKSAVSVQAWQQAAESVRMPLGALQKRVEKSATVTRTLPGAPDGQYVVIQYDAAFEKKANAVETLTLAQDSDGRLRVAGYFIK